MRAKRIPAALALLAATGCGVAGTGTYFAPVAAVACSTPKQCEEIAEADIASTLRTVLAQPGSSKTFSGPQGEINRLQAKREILSELIRDSIVRQQAAGLKVKLTRREVAATLDQVRDRLKGEGEFKKVLAAQGLTHGELHRLISNQLLYEKVAARITKDAVPPEEQLRRFYDQNKSTYEQRIKLAHILICENFDPQRGCNATPQDQAVAGQVATRARTGDEFAALAKEFSDDRQSAERGGELGYVGKGDLATEFEKAAFALANPGDVSDPVRTQFGFHVIKLLSKGQPFEDARADIVELMSREMRRQTLNRFISRVVSNATVKVNPKFGRFDPSSLTVVPLKIQIPQQPRSPAPGRPPAPAQAPQAPAGQPGG